MDWWFWMALGAGAGFLAGRLVENWSVQRALRK